MKENNRFSVDSSYPGLCSLCNTEVAEFNGMIQVMQDVWRPRITKLKGNFRAKNVELSNGTIMTVTLCDQCVNLNPEDCGPLMESEIRGWGRECRELLGDIKQEIRDNHLAQQSTLTIKDVPSMGWTEDLKARISAPKFEAMNLSENILANVLKPILAKEIVDASLV